MLNRHLTWMLPLAMTLAVLLVPWKQGEVSSRAHDSKRSLPAHSRIAAASRLVPHPSPSTAIPPQALHQPILEALAQGLPLEVRSQERLPITLILKPHDLLEQPRGIRLGTQKRFIKGAQVFTGFAFPSESASVPSPRRAAVALVGSHLHGSWRHEDGSEFRLQGRLNAPSLTLTQIQPAQSEGILEESDSLPLTACRLVERQPEQRLATASVQLALPTSARGGLEPATAEPTRFMDPFPLSERYALSLKDLSLLLVLDQWATGPNEQDSLEALASRWLATVANVATLYENQLGLRLRLQELILIPDDPQFTDINFSQPLPDFTSWVGQHRPRQAHQWNSAFKVGKGLRSTELGIAYVGSLGRSDSIGIIGRETGWTTLAHELGHSLGSNHTKGGLMNAQANGGGDRDFFTVVQGSLRTTAAEEIYTLTHTKLTAGPPMRHPREIPFAQNDFRVVSAEHPSEIRPLGNDLTHPPFGTPNTALNLDGISRLLPKHAGQISQVGDTVRFVPTSGYHGPVWFSYALRGSVGNERQGWLHKGDITLQVGSAAPPQDLRFRPGEARTIEVGEPLGEITPPAQAWVHALTETPGHVLIRASANAEGTDSFAVGSHQFRLTYANPSVETVADAYWHRPSSGPLRMFPLANDAPSSEGSLEGQPKISLSAEPNAATIAPFPTALRLRQAMNLSPDKGSLETIRHPPVPEGSPTGELIFTPEPGARGTVSIRYEVEDPSGATATEFITIHLRDEAVVLVDTDAPARYHIPQHANDASAWRQRSFNDRGWPIGSLPIGYEMGLGYEPWIHTDVGRQMAGVNGSLYIRIPFIVESPEDFTDLILRMRMDDGVVAYLNGISVWSENVPSQVTWNALAPEGKEADAFVAYDLSEARSVLQSGENLLALHAMNSQIDSSDFLVMPQLVAYKGAKLAKIITPQAAALSIGQGTGLRFQGEPQEEGITLQWMVTEAPADSPLLDTRHDGSHFDVYFETAGTYRIQLQGERSDGARTTDSRVVRVDSPSAYDQWGGSLRVMVDPLPRSLETELSTSLTPAVPGQDGTLQWERLAGPGEVTFSSPQASETAVTFGSPGRYQLRLRSDQPTVVLFDDVWIDVLTETRELVGATARPTYQFFSTEAAPTGWQAPDFADMDWFRGQLGVGYDLTGSFDRHIQTEVQSLMYNRHSSVFLRYPFVVERPRSIDRLVLGLRADDGCVLYLNQQEVFRQHAPLYNLSPGSTATRAVDETQLTSPTTIDLTEFAHLLRPGYNVLAVHGLNERVTSSDFLIQPTLTARLGQLEAFPNSASPSEMLLSAFEAFAVRTLSTEDGRVIEISFSPNPELARQGGRIDPEASADLVYWERWPFAEAKREWINEARAVIRLTSPQHDRFRFFRLRVTY